MSGQTSLYVTRAAACTIGDHLTPGGKRQAEAVGNALRLRGVHLTHARASTNWRDLYSAAAVIRGLATHVCIDSTLRWERFVIDLEHMLPLERPLHYAHLSDLLALHNPKLQTLSAAAQLMAREFSYLADLYHGATILVIGPPILTELAIRRLESPNDPLFFYHPKHDLLRITRVERLRFVGDQFLSRTCAVDLG